jgi:hypothetical protein
MRKFHMMIRFYFILLLLPFISFSQNEFPLLDSTEQVRIRVEITGNEAFLRLLQLPESAEFSIMHIGSVNGDCSVAFRLEPSLLGQQAIRFSVGDRCTDGDTLVMMIQGQYNSMDYPPVYIMPGTFTVRFGENCYVLSCIPKNDPWMPYVKEPFLLSEDYYYLNPGNGKIYKGKRLIHYGRFDACDLQDFRLISPYAWYFDKNKVSHSGSELIRKRKVDLKEWDIEQF